MATTEREIAEALDAMCKENDGRKILAVGLREAYREYNRPPKKKRAKPQPRAKVVNAS